MVRKGVDGAACAVRTVPRGATVLDCTLSETLPQFGGPNGVPVAYLPATVIREALVVMAAVSTTWSVRLLRRSGREAARWTLGEASGGQLEQLWNRLSSSSAPPRPTPHQRYGGLLVSHGEDEFLIYAEHVERRDRETSDHRHDPGRSLEALILGSAPSGCLPPEG